MTLWRWPSGLITTANRFIFGILSLLLAAVIAFVALPTIARQTNGKEEIVRITQPVLKGEQISSENAEVVEVGGYKEIDRCATEGGMFRAITYCNPKYTASLNKVLEILEQMELAEQSEEDAAYECEEDADE